MRKRDECGMGKLGTLDSSEKIIAIIVGDRWRPQTAKQERDSKISKMFLMLSTGKTE